MLQNLAENYLLSTVGYEISNCWLHCICAALAISLKKDTKVTYKHDLLTVNGNLKFF